MTEGPRRRVRLVRAGFPEPPERDTAVSRALMELAGAGEEPETLRVHWPGRVLALGRLDRVSPGYAEAVAAARRAGFAPVERLAGGRAAVFHEGTIAFAWAVPDPDPKARIQARFEEVAGIVAAAFRAVGVDARVGEVPGEYCPGRHSVNAGGERKLMGVGQRLVTGAAHVGGVVVVDGADLLNGVLQPVYAAMGFDWDPSATGSLAAEVPGLSWEDAERAVLDAFAERYDLVEEPALSAGVLALAERLEPEHRPST
ncbi:MAG: lipoate--protein ligase family protein [Actinobacteria bacterium]|nr:lipoate--protein ligase family protein [Actinomycetota bacterium]